jgi:hypothetical protein
VATFVFLQARLISTEVERAVYDADLDLFSIQNYDRHSINFNAHNYIARAAAQIRTGHWRSAIYLKRIRKRTDSGCWFCKGGAAMTRSHVLLHCSSARMSAARKEAWEGRDSGGLGVLLASPR